MSSRILQLFTGKGLKEATTAAALLSAVAGATIAVFGGAQDQSRTGAADELRQQVFTLSRIAAAQRARIDALSNYVDTVSRTGSPNATTAGIAQLQARVVTVEHKQAEIEKVILASPASALAIPMLRKDLDNVRDRSAADLAANNAAIDRIYDLNKYVVLTIFASIVLLAITQFLKPKSGS